MTMVWETQSNWTCVRTLAMNIQVYWIWKRIHITKGLLYAMLCKHDFIVGEALYIEVSLNCFIETLWICFFDCRFLWETEWNPTCVRTLTMNIHSYWLWKFVLIRNGIWYIMLCIHDFIVGKTCAVKIHWILHDVTFFDCIFELFWERKNVAFIPFALYIV